MHRLLINPNSANQRQILSTVVWGLSRIDFASFQSCFDIAFGAVFASISSWVNFCEV